MVRRDVKAAAVPSRFEWGVAIAALFVLERFPLVFVRLRLIHILGPIRWPDWEYDLYVRIAFALVFVVVVAVACRRFQTDDLVRQPFLLAFLAMAWASTVWSIEPGITLWRSMMLIGTALTGWYIADRFSLQQVAVVVASAAAGGAAASLVAVLVVPKLATTTAHLHAWSGIYVNRNILGAVMSVGILASLFLLTRAPARARIAEVVAILAELGLLAKTGNRTGPMALGGALLVCGAVFVIRGVVKGKLSAFWASILSLGTIFIGFGAIEWQWKKLLALVGRKTTLTSRIFVWRVDRAFIGLKPWGGWGYEAVWPNPGMAAYATRILKRFPYEAHNGYYEVGLGLGRIGIAILVLFLAVTLYRAFVFAWRGHDVLSLWPLGLVTFVLAVNFTESFFVSSEALFLLVIAMAFGLSRTTTILVRRPTL